MWSFVKRVLTFWRRNRQDIDKCVDATKNIVNRD